MWQMKKEAWAGQPVLTYSINTDCNWGGAKIEFVGRGFSVGSQMWDVQEGCAYNRHDSPVGLLAASMNPRSRLRHLPDTPQACHKTISLHINYNFLHSN